MTPTECKTRQCSERSDAYHKLALTITYTPTFHDQEKMYRITNEERFVFIQTALDYLLGRGVLVTDKNYEEGNNERLHLHCIANTKVRLYPYPKLKNYRLEFRKLFYPKGWSLYKDKENQSWYKQKQVESYFKTNYAFDQL